MKILLLFIRFRLLIRQLSLSAAVAVLLFVAGVGGSFSNVTLTSLGGDLSVVVYLPVGIKPNEEVYYYASRFEHGSMIGSITRKHRYIDETGVERVEQHDLYGIGLWRPPHNRNWPESGIGLASEFGVGDDGDLCLFRCGWTAAEHVTNGVLGYREALPGQPFLKIGVGQLLKGTCPACDSTDDYRFNSPYMFAKQPDWKMSRTGDGGVRLENADVLRNHGYQLVKDIALRDNVLSVTSTLTNLGTEPFTTAWYSHHIFSCDGSAVGPNYSIDLQIRGDRDLIYQEPGTWSWSKPLSDYARVSAYPDHVHVGVFRDLDPGIRIKTEFVNDGQTKGGFSLNACQSSVTATIPELNVPGLNMPMYGYNLYVERGTFSPEPQILLHLEPGQSRTWTQRLVIGDEIKVDPVADKKQQQGYPVILGLRQRAAASLVSAVSTNLRVDDGTGRRLLALVTLMASVSLFALLVQDLSSRYRRRRNYRAIP